MTAPIAQTRLRTVLSVDEAVACIKAAAPAMRSQSLALSRARMRVLASPITAQRDQPPFDASAMDGYAVSAPLLPGQSLRLIGESRAGHGFLDRPEADEAVRIYTGAPVPPGANGVVLQEHVTGNRDTINLKPGAVPCAKSHIRPQGSDFRTGDVLLRAGESLDAGRLALAAAAGVAKLQVARRPRVAIVCCGDELVSAGQAVRGDQIFESNSYALNALISRWGGRTTSNIVMADDAEGLVQYLRDCPAEIIVTVGGASVGDYDLVRPALDALDICWSFDKVDIRPGRPTAFGSLPDGRCVLCLPGNPTSALVCAHLFLRPLIETTLSISIPSCLKTLSCATDLPANGPREAYLLSRIEADADGIPVLLPLSEQDSSRIRLFAQASVLIRRQPNAAAILAGERCQYISL